MDEWKCETVVYKFPSSRKFLEQRDAIGLFFLAELVHQFTFLPLLFSWREKEKRWTGGNSLAKSIVRFVSRKLLEVAPNEPNVLGYVPKFPLWGKFYSKYIAHVTYTIVYRVKSSFLGEKVLERSLEM